MRIAHNLSAINTINSLSVSENKMEKAMEKLSSGYRINRAADDAAGLAISEKMRAQIRGLHQASRNAQDGISLIQTAEGALGEVHNILQRIHELSVQAASGTYSDEDRRKSQLEVDQLINDIERTSKNTEFNGKRLLGGTVASTASAASVVASESSMKLHELINNNSNKLNLVYVDQTDDFETVQSSAGTATISGYTNLKNVLQTEIVPQAVTSVLNAFSPAFNYLSSSSIGIGLNLYSNTSTTTLAAVKLGFYTSGQYVDNTMLLYQLSVNMASLSFDTNGNLTSSSRNALETTIVHEMVHGFMDEALTNGMIGITNGAQDSSNSFPSWFKEGMAQSAAGGYANCNDWVNSGLGITTSTTQTAISSTVTSSSNSLSSGTTVSKYATGYLACMYLGYLASGSTNITAGDISNGLGKILSDLIGGKSLNTVINERTGGKYTSASDFQSKFGDPDSSSFIYRLTQTVGSTGNGGLATGNLLDSDLLPNTPISTALFELDTTNDTVKNVYPSDVNVLSGGGNSSTGTAPVGDYSTTIGGGTGPVINPGSTIDLGNIAGVSGISYDSGLNVLTITTSGDYTLTGVNTTGVRVVVQNGVNANITLNNAKINTSTGAGISLEGSANVALNLVGSNSVTTTKQGAAGIRVTTGATLTIQGSGSLDAESIYYGINNGAGIGGGNGEDGGNIIINEGSIKVTGTGMAAGIGGGGNGDGGNITINGGNITIQSQRREVNTYCSGAGIGGGFGRNGGNIIITGGIVNSTAERSGAGIGCGNRGTGGSITITGGTITAGSTSGGAGIGGGAVVGGNVTITISGGNVTSKGGYLGAGIGSGEHGTGGNITITGGTIIAEGGSYNGSGGAGIGGGASGNVGDIDINGEGVIVKAKGGSGAADIGGGSYYRTPVSGGTVTKTTGIIFEGASGRVYGNATLGGFLDCDGGTLTVNSGSTLTVLGGGRITDHGTFTNSGRIENHGVIGSVSGTGITHHYVTGITKNILEPDTATIGESLAESLSKLSPSTMSVAYNGTSKTLTGTWSVTDMNGNPITDLAGTIVGENDKYIYTVSFGSQDNMYFDPLNMSIYEMNGSNADEAGYKEISDEYISALGPAGGGLALSYSYIVGSAPASVVLPPTDPTGITGGIVIQLGANKGQTMAITIDSVKTHDLEIDSLSVLTANDAENAIQASYKAINKVSQIRGNLGAYQNRLEHAILNIDNMEENLQASESRIRDMDMADGMAEYAKYQILMQVGQAMLAQANQSPKDVLTLLS